MSQAAFFACLPAAAFQAIRSSSSPRRCVFTTTSVALNSSRRISTHRCGFASPHMNTSKCRVVCFRPAVDRDVAFRENRNARNTAVRCELMQVEMQECCACHFDTPFQRFVRRDFDLIDRSAPNKSMIKMCSCKTYAIAFDKEVLRFFRITAPRVSSSREARFTRSSFWAVLERVKSIPNWKRVSS
jgi:hypothetical protein